MMNPETTKGYKRVSLTKDGESKKYFIHRLVANEFLEKIKGKEYINHKNGVKDDNNLSNLEWCTPSENEHHSYNTLGKVKIGVKGKMHKSSKPIIAINLETGDEMMFDSRNIAAEQLNVDGGSITKVTQGKQRKAKGYFFYYKQ